MKHTPGPWILVYADEVAVERQGMRHPPMSVRVPFEERCANARLIAAAPELLAALECQASVEDWIETADHDSPFFAETTRRKLNHARDLREAAISKSKGE